MPDPISLIVLTCVFVIVLICSLAGLSHARIFTPHHCILLSVITAILSILALIEMFRPPQDVNSRTPAPTSTSDWITTLLIPYATLGFALFLVVLALSVLRFFKTKRGSERPLRRNADWKRCNKTGANEIRRTEQSHCLDAKNHQSIQLLKRRSHRESSGTVYPRFER